MTTPLPDSLALLLQPVTVGAALGIGVRGELTLMPGHYVYVGSAHGPGGLAGRLRHHLGPIRRPHWHIDYLRGGCHVLGVWLTNGRRALEHVWLRRLAALDAATVPMPGFGASDCDCPTHLIHLPSSTTRAGITAAFGGGRAPGYLPRPMLASLG